jgi:hypothetical protein
MTIHSVSGSEIKIGQIEQDLVARGFQQVEIVSTKFLRPFHYFKSSHQGSAENFEGEITYHITWAE